MFAAMILATVTPLASPLPAIDAKADALLAAARAYVARRVFPATLSYRVAIALTDEHGRSVSRTYESGYDAVRDVVYTHAVSDEENAHPFTPRGTNVVVGFSASTSTGSTGTSVRVNKPADLPDVLGVPMLSPTYAFGLSHESAPVSDDESSSLQVIGRVNAGSRAYYASYIGDEVIDGETCAHLRLLPAYHPERLRLRELWVAADGAPVAAVTHGNFTSRPWDGLDWLITFERDGSALYVRSETTEQSVRIDKSRHGVVSVTFQDISADDVRKRFLLSIEPGNPVTEPH